MFKGEELTRHAELAPAPRLVAMGLEPCDSVQLSGYSGEWLRINFGDGRCRDVVGLTVYSNGTALVGTSTCLNTRGYLPRLRAYARALEFICRYNLNDGSD